MSYRVSGTAHGERFNEGGFATEREATDYASAIIDGDIDSDVRVETEGGELITEPPAEAGLSDEVEAVLNALDRLPISQRVTGSGFTARPNSWGGVDLHSEDQAGEWVRLIREDEGYVTVYRFTRASVMISSANFSGVTASLVAVFVSGLMDEVTR